MGELVCVRCLCAGVSVEGFMGLFVICKTKEAPFVYMCVCVCVWEEGEFVLICVSGGLSSTMRDCSVVLSMLWFSQAGWDVG